LHFCHGHFLVFRRGFEQTFITGPVDIAANLEAGNDIWKQGSIKISSENGRLSKLILLSKLFKIINLTDLLSTYEGSGFQYSELNIEAHIKDDSLILDKAVIIGNGLNLFGEGTIKLDTLETNLTLFIVPFKTLDAVLKMVPIVGRLIGGEKGSILTIPVGVNGKLRDPEVTVLPPQAIGEAAKQLFLDTIKMPFELFKPEETDGVEDESIGKKDFYSGFIF